MTQALENKEIYSQEKYWEMEGRNRLFSVSSGLEDTLMQQSLECKIKLADMYQNVEFSSYRNPT